MMDPSNLDHHHQEELHGGSSSSLPSPSFHLVGGNHEWNHNLILNAGVFIPSISGVLSGSRDFRPSDETPAPTISTHMVQDLGFHWGSGSYMNPSAHQATLERIEELSGFTRDPSTTGDYHLPSTSCIKHEQQGMHDMDESSLLRALGHRPPGGDLFLGAPPCLTSFAGSTERGRGNYSTVLPTAHVSSIHPPLSSSSYQISLGMDLQALDLLASARFGRSFCDPSPNSMALLREDTPFGLISHLQEPAQGPSNGHHKISPLISGATGSKRANGDLEHKASQVAAKKPRLIETRSSFSPFKVRKEKLGDRIAALQQLVAPFGKTDTASVLMEAIGYIKFLQDQVETLSVPYMRSSNNIKLRTTQGASSEDTDESKPDLRSRGLCLVPLSYMSYVNNENGGVWSPPPNYRGSN